VKIDVRGGKARQSTASTSERPIAYEARPFMISFYIISLIQRLVGGTE
jgi:hypothetical protein